MKLTVKNGCFSYNKSENKLNQINFEVENGDLLAILGANGAGKTTLLRCITGLLKWNSGESYINEKRFSSLSARELWQTVAYVPQAKNTYSAFTAEEMILLGQSSRLNVFQKPKKADYIAVQKTMESLGILHLKNKKCNEISGGELQMVLIAKALAVNPQILVLDEPESNLDFKNQLMVLNVMSEFAASGKICIFNTHYPAHALMRANKSLLIKNGGYAFGKTCDVVTESNIQEAFSVKSVISEIETDGNIFKSVVPLTVANGSFISAEDDGETRAISVISVILEKPELADRINSLLHKYNQYLVGRMGMPYRSAGVFIINITLDSTKKLARELAAELNILPGVSVKTTFSGKDLGGV